MNKQVNLFINTLSFAKTTDRFDPIFHRFQALTFWHKSLKRYYLCTLNKYHATKRTGKVGDDG